MTEESYPFGKKSLLPGSKKLSEKQWAQAFRYVLGTGVMSVSFQDQLDDLLVGPGALPLKVNIKSGSAWIQGHYYQNDSVNTLTISQNIDASIRADMIVLECKWGLDAGITAKVVEGTPGAIWPVTSSRAGSPMPPTPVQTYGVRWQLPLAQVNTSQNKYDVYATTDIIDWRTFVNSGGAKSSTYVVASDDASPLIRANADAVIPWGSVNAEQVINEAISVVSDFGGGTVLLSEGPHDTSDSILPLSNVNLRGLGKRTLIQYHLGNHNPVIKCDTVDNVTISDLSIDGGGATLVDASWSSSTAISGYDGIGITDGSFVLVRNCFIERCNSNGIGILSTDSSLTESYGHRVEGCYIGDNAANGILIQSNGGIFTNNQINHNGQGVYIVSEAGTGSYGSSINVVSNNSVRMNMEEGVELRSAADSGKCAYNSVCNNIVSNNSRHAHLANSNMGLVGVNTKYNIIQGNTSQGWLTPGPKYALYLDAVNNYNLISGNYLFPTTTIDTPTTGMIAIGPSFGGAQNRINYNFVTTSKSGTYD